MNVRERILRVATHKFSRHGFYKVSMDNIVKELKTSKSSVYNHFASKEDLVKAVIDQLNIEINSSLNDILTDDKLSFKGKLIAISQFTGDLLTRISGDFLSDLELYTPNLWEYYQTTRIDRINKYYRQLFETGIIEGRIRKDLQMDVILATYMILMELPLKTGYHRNLKLDMANIYDSTTEIFLNGIMRK
jgi:AcrR family transcriptional regulator